jgi:uncharacterized protein
VILAWAVVVVVVFGGAVVQGAVGFGMNLMVAPVAALLTPELVPGPLLIVAAIHMAALAYRERAHLEFAPLGWAWVGRVPGTVVGAVIVSVVSTDGLAVVFGASTLIAVALSASRGTLAPTPFNLTVAGAASGTMATAVSVGGPPMALVLLDREPNSRRGLMAGFLGLGSLISFTVLLAVGEIDAAGLLGAAVLVPVALTGLWLSGRLADGLDAERARAAVFVVAGASAVALLLRGLL